MESGPHDQIVPSAGQQSFRPELRSAEPLPEARTDGDSIETRLFALAQILVQRGEDHAHLSPGIPPLVLGAALESYLDLRDDEVLLAIVGIPAQGGGRLGCALTTGRLYWPDTRWDSAGAGPPRCQSVRYALLPDDIKRRGDGAIDLGDGRGFGTLGASGLRTALIEFLSAARVMSRGEAPPQAIRERELKIARMAWPRVAAASDEARLLQAEVRQFESRMMRVSRAIVIPVVVLACAVVYVAMIVNGASPFTPNSEQLLLWGANYGPAVIIDHQFWRLFTSMFVHIGFWHVLVNMIILATSGRLVERLFGHFGFAALYVLSGLGGSIVSVWSQPMVVGAGASGAIFGIFGALLGFLAIRRRDLPLSVLKAMLAGAIGLVVYNIFFGSIMPGISMPAHLGGLVTGFVGGLLITAASPTDARANAGVVPYLREAAVASLVALGLMVLGYTGNDMAKAIIQADPSWELKDLVAATAPIFSEFNRINQQIGRIGSDVDTGRRSKREAIEALDRLKSDGVLLAQRIQSIQIANSELQAIRDQLAKAQSSQQQMIASAERFFATGDVNHIDGPAGFRASDQARVKDLEQMKSLRDAFLKSHNLREAASNESTKP
jgi:rhomboid protease GluP